MAACLAWDGYIRLEGASNVHGGIKTGSIYNGTAKLDATYAEVFKVGLIGATHNQSLNSYTGAVQTATSMDVQREIKLGNLNYLHYFSPNLTGRIGVMDMEDFYDITESAVYLRNSAFVNAMAIDKTTQLASFPYPGFGALLEYKERDNYILFGLYQGNPQHLSTVFYRGYMLIAEGGGNIPLHYGTMQNLSLKLGAWIYDADSIPGYTNAQGLYLISQINWLYNAHSMDGFLQLAYSDEDPKTIPYSLTIGVRANNIFCNNDVDWLTFGIGKVWIYGSPSEVVFELAYAYKFWDKFYLNPDVQYFIRPSGIYPNATVFLLRLSYVF